MLYLNLDDIRYCHNEILKHTLILIEKRKGFLTEADRLQNSSGEFEGKLDFIMDFFLYPPDKKYSIHTRISRFIYMVCTLHPFIEGNKRTAYFVSDVILTLNGLRIQTSSKEADDFITEVAKGNVDPHEIERWIHKKCKIMFLPAILILLVQALYCIGRNTRDVDLKRIYRTEAPFIKGIRTFVETFEI